MSINTAKDNADDASSIDNMISIYEQIDKFQMLFKKNESESQKHPWTPVLDELTRTEHQYMEDITSIINGYFPAFKKLCIDQPEIITQEITDSIFINLEQIHAFHQIFYDKLKSIIGENELSDVGHLFSNSAEKFKVYTEYCANHPKSVDILVKLCKNKSIDTVLRSVQHKLGHQLNLSAYLLKPCQRVLKYRLLLESMIKHSSNNEEARNLLTVASQRMDSIAKEINEIIACTENQQLLEEIEDGLSEWHDTNNLTEQGKIHLQGTLLDLGASKSRQERFAILFDKGLFICKRREQMIKQASAKQTKFKKGREPYKYKHFIKITDLTFTQDDYIKKDDLSFLLHNGTGKSAISLSMRAKSYVQKNHWLSTLQDVVLDSFNFSPELLQQILETLRLSSISTYCSEDLLTFSPNSVVSLPTRQYTQISMDRNQDNCSVVLDGSVDSKIRSTSLYTYIEHAKMSTDSQTLICEADSDTNDNPDNLLDIDRDVYSHRLDRKSCPLPAIPTLQSTPAAANVPDANKKQISHDSAIVDDIYDTIPNVLTYPPYLPTALRTNFSSHQPTTEYYNVLLSKMKQNAESFQQQTNNKKLSTSSNVAEPDRDSGYADASSFVLDYKMYSIKHKGMVNKLAQQYMQTVASNNMEHAYRTQALHETKVPASLNLPATTAQSGSSSADRSVTPEPASDKTSSKFSFFSKSSNKNKTKTGPVNDEKCTKPPKRKEKTRYTKNTNKLAMLDDKQVITDKLSGLKPMNDDDDAPLSPKKPTPLTPKPISISSVSTSNTESVNEYLTSPTDNKKSVKTTITIRSHSTQPSKPHVTSPVSRDANRMSVDGVLSLNKNLTGSNPDLSPAPPTHPQYKYHTITSSNRSSSLKSNVLSMAGRYEQNVEEHKDECNKQYRLKQV